MDDLDYKPRNSKEKWLFRIVSWGTIALVTLPASNSRAMRCLQT